MTLVFPVIAALTVVIVNLITVPSSDNVDWPHRPPSAVLITGLHPCCVILRVVTNNFHKSRKGTVTPVNLITVGSSDNADWPHRPHQLLCE